MEMSTFDRQMAVDRRAYETLREQITRDHAGKFVAIAFGNLMAPFNSFHEALYAVQALRPAPEHYLVFAADEQPIFDEVEAWHVEYQ